MRQTQTDRQTETQRETDTDRQRQKQKQTNTEQQSKHVLVVVQKLIVIQIFAHDGLVSAYPTTRDWNYKIRHIPVGQVTVVPIK